MWKQKHTGAEEREEMQMRESYESWEVIISYSGE